MCERSSLNLLVEKVILFSRLSKKITLFYFCLVPESDTMSVILKRVELLYNNMEYTVFTIFSVDFATLLGKDTLVSE